MVSFRDSSTVGASPEQAAAGGCDFHPARLPFRRQARSLPSHQTNAVSAVSGTDTSRIACLFGIDAKRLGRLEVDIAFHAKTTRTLDAGDLG